MTTGVLLWREMLTFFRQRSRVMGAFATPILFWIFVGAGIGKSFQVADIPGGQNYLEYFFPGTWLMILLFSSVFSTFSIIEDRKAGFMQNVLVAPTSDWQIVLGKSLGGTFVAAIQAFLFLLAAPLIGIHIQLVPVILISLLSLLIGQSLTAMGFWLAWRVNSSGGLHGILNVILFPMWLLSGAAFPPSGAPVWVQWIMKINPLTYALDLVRKCLYWNAEGTQVVSQISTGISLIILFLFLGGMMFLSMYEIRRKVY